MNALRAQELLEQLRVAGVTATGITADSRSVKHGDVFAAWPGFATDGRQFISDAVARGAVAVLWESRGDYRAEALAVPSFGVSGLRDLAGFLAHEIFKRPSSALWVAGVTGTNGKTTVSHWLAQAMNELGLQCGIVGTLGWGYADALADAGNTTPDALALHRMFANFVARGAAGAAIEVSSIGLEQGRVNGVAFDVAVLTNLSRDHLDYHGTMEAYGAAKGRLFDQPGLGCAVVNFDDAFGLSEARRLVAAGTRVIGYTRAAENAHAVAGAEVVSAQDVREAPTGMRFTVRWGGKRVDAQLKVVAAFNVSNALAVVAALLARDVPLVDAVRAVSRLSSPAGRMQLLGGVGEPLIVIDYAHSPDALAKVLEAVRDTARARGGRLVCVFGCGGDRDPGKRALMGEAAERGAQRVIVTSDNPRSEEPRAIAEAVMRGAGEQATCILDRAEAIRTAIREASADDVIVLAGKGHEAYQEVHGERLPFSDAVEAGTALREWNHAQGAPDVDPA